MPSRLAAFYSSLCPWQWSAFCIFSLVSNFVRVSCYTERKWKLVTRSDASRARVGWYECLVSDGGHQLNGYKLTSYFILLSGCRCNLLPVLGALPCTTHNGSLREDNEKVIQFWWSFYAGLHCADIHLGHHLLPLDLHQPIPLQPDES